MQHPACRRIGTKQFVRHHINLSRKEWWRLIRASMDMREWVEDFVAQAVRNRLDDLEAPWADPPASAKPREGFVYAMAYKGLIKLGLSNNPEYRSKQLGAALLCQIATKDMVWAECYLHDIYEPFRVHGEWYRLSRRQVEEIVKLTDRLSGPPETDEADDE